jgi:molybdopterin converting factor small subunit
MSVVTVHLFASYADAFGAPQLRIPLDPGSTVGDLVRRIQSLPSGNLLPPSPRVAVNRKFASPDKLIGSADEIALIPPVAGG